LQALSLFYHSSDKLEVAFTFKDRLKVSFLVSFFFILYFFFPIAISNIQNLSMQKGFSRQEPFQSDPTSPVPGTSEKDMQNCQKPFRNKFGWGFLGGRGIFLTAAVFG